MKKMLLLIFISIFSSEILADCSIAKTSPEIQKCLNNEVRSLRSQLDKVYQNIQQQTQAKLELQKSQDLWVKYKEMQCGDFVVADSQGSPATIEYDLACQSILYKQRIDLLKSIFN
ncbi:lysozyme inhibitor LprI family protein [Acinetobacter sichuanensis]|uniref:lysozyme inhibitor LprI family protein n=1 Tax=Acinetobacter sichuanensis TaxID=2136183 RepID=UPI00280F278B|nr:lysozyme inhibitor LprI family protein [Acinetobacter sichuanensis]MDQ9023174.1 lysozyme inhibitor LprI family protein [Acinetobacter sichuanensis]